MRNILVSHRAIRSCYMRLELSFTAMVTSLNVTHATLAYDKHYFYTLNHVEFMNALGWNLDAFIRPIENSLEYYQRYRAVLEPIAYILYTRTDSQFHWNKSQIHIIYLQMCILHLSERSIWHVLRDSTVCHLIFH